MQVLHDQLDFNQYQLLNAVLQNLAAAPSSPEVGQVYYDTALEQARLFKSGGWADLGEMTAAEILDALITVDGSGSGLDADLLDGQGGTHYLDRANHTGTQTAATISDLAESVQDLVGAMVSGNTETGIAVTYEDSDGTLDFVVDSEWVQDQIGAILADTATLDLTYDDAGNAITGTVLDSPTVAGATPAQLRDRSTHTGTQPASTISDLAEAAQDAVGGILADTATLDLTYDDAGNQITGAVLDSPTVGGATPAQLRDRSTHTGTQTAATISDLAEAVDDRVAVLIVAGNQLAATYDDGAGTLTLDVEEGPGSGLDADTVDGNEASALLARSNHTGTQAAVTISDFDTQVRTSRLDQMAAPTAAVDLNSQKITSLAAGTADSDAVNLLQVRDLVRQLDRKDSVRVASDSNVTIASPGASIDGVALSNGDSVLLSGQTAGAENGIYVWNGAAVPMTRRDDADSSAEVTAGMTTVVEEGTYADKRAILATNNPITLGTTSLTFTFESTGETIVGGAGLTKTGGQLDVGAGTGIVVNADDVAIDTTVVARWSSHLIGNGAASTFVVNHGRANQWVQVQVVKVSTEEVVLCGVELTDANNVTVSIEESPGTPIAANSYRVNVVG